MPDIGKDFLAGSQFNFSNRDQTRVRQLEAQAQKLELGKKGNELKALHATGAAKDTTAEMEKAATDFEALLLHQMIKAMWKTVPKEGILSGTREEEIYTDMFSDTLSRDIAKGQSIGIADAMLKDMKRTYGKNK